MTQEEKAKAYDKVVNKLRRFIEQGVDPLITKADVQDFFPELKESEDERIRKAIIELVRQSSEVLDKQNQNNMIDWLEKQGEQKKSYDTCDFSMMDNKKSPYGEKRDFGYFEEKSVVKIEPTFKVGDWVVCEITGSVYQIKNCIENLSNHKYGYDLTNGGYIGSDEVNHYHLWTIQDAKDGDVLVASDGSIFLFADVVDCACKYYVALATDNYIKINKEEKGGYWETSRAVYPATKEQRDLLFQKMHEAGYEWDTDKLELYKKPKFKVGDWVVYYRNDSSKEILYVYDIRDGRYYLNDNIHLSWSVKECDEKCHLWSIQDAKDGDVLYCESSGIEYIIILKQINNRSLDSYCRYNTIDGFAIDVPRVMSIQDNPKPATKEQRDTLMEAMADAGWEFDFEKKELKKIEQKLAWSEEDEKMMMFCCDYLDDNQESWLKSLKDRINNN